jgi:hypothetical protein
MYSPPLVASLKMAASRQACIPNINSMRMCSHVVLGSWLWPRLHLNWSHSLGWLLSPPALGSTLGHLTLRLLCVARALQILTEEALEEGREAPDLPAAAYTHWYSLLPPICCTRAALVVHHPSTRGAPDMGGSWFQLNARLREHVLGKARCCGASELQGLFHVAMGVVVLHRPPHSQQLFKAARFSHACHCRL